MSDCENNGCFCLDELTECGENLKRLIAALNEQYPVYLEKRDYGSISELHITAKALWAEFANILHPLGEYGDENLYSTALKMFEAIQRFGYLNGGNYPALISALNSFADMLPNKKSIDAKAAAHLMNRIKMGYFPIVNIHCVLSEVELAEVTDDICVQRHDLKESHHFLLFFKGIEAVQLIKQSQHGVSLFAAKIPVTLCF